VHALLPVAAGGISWILRWLVFRLLWRTGGAPLVIAFFVALLLVPLAIRRWRSTRR
jgi:hypothetical protein